MKNKSYDAEKIDNYQHYKKFLSVIVNKTRYDIILSLRKGQRSVNQLISNLGYEQSRVSHNLKILELNGLIRSKREGKSTIYSLEKNLIKILKNFDQSMKNYERTLKNMKGGGKK